MLPPPGSDIVVGRNGGLGEGQGLPLGRHPDQEPVPHHREAEGQRDLVEHEHVNIVGLEEGAQVIVEIRVGAQPVVGGQIRQDSDIQVSRGVRRLAQGGTDLQFQFFLEVLRS